MRCIPLKWKLLLVQGIHNLRYFGPRIAWARERCILSDDALCDVIYKDQVIIDWLYQKYDRLIEKYQSKITVESEELIECSPEPIWVLWWQGEASMPPIIQLCQKSKLKNANGHEVILLTQDNVKQYIEFPEYVWEQFDAGKIRIQHLADMIRVQLIWRYGGIWLDASVFCSRQFSDMEFSSKLFSIKQKNNRKFISECRWTTFAIGGQKGHVLFAFLNEFFIEYCKTGRPFIDYFMFDCGIALAYRHIYQVRTDIDCIPASNSDIYWLNDHLSCQISENLLKQFNAHCHSLSKIVWAANREIEHESNSLLRYLYNSYQIKDHDE